MPDIKINGATPSAYYFGSTAATAVYYGSTKLWEAGSPTPSLPANTIRCKFASGYTPTMGTSQTLVDADENIWDIYKSSNNWDVLFKNNANLQSIIGANTTGVTSMLRLFYGCSNLTSVSLFDTSSVTDMTSMFHNCTYLTSVPLFDTSSATSMSNMFFNCLRLPSVPLFDTSSARNLENMFYNCRVLTSVPLFDTSSATYMGAMFYNCYRVESGALALYTQASSQTTPPASYSNCFFDCGRDTTSGAAELAQIPSDWGGTGT